MHYDMISALHKSLRGSDPDASLYWLARMIEGGEDPLFIMRRLVRFASEDVGNADPLALSLTISATEAFKFIGPPEGYLALAQAAVYLALCEKSNAVYTAYGAAARDARDLPEYPVPMHIRNAPTKIMTRAWLRRRIPVPARSSRGPRETNLPAQRTPGKTILSSDRQRG